MIRIRAAEPVTRQLAILEAHVQSAASSVLGATGYRSLDPRLPLQEFGLDSLMSVELRNALAKSLDCSLPATLLFDYPTVEGLTRYLAKEVLNLEPANQESLEMLNRAQPVPAPPDRVPASELSFVVPVRFNIR